VSATVQTDPVRNSGDAADDPTIWVNPTDPSLSTVIGTDKKGGLAVYGLDGQEIQYLPVGRMNNVDIRADFNLGGEPTALVTAGNRTNNTLAIFRVNPSTRKLEDVSARQITTGSVYGSCMYQSNVSGRSYYFVNSKTGAVEQWELFETSQGKVDAKRVRTFSVGSQTEGCVADDELGHLYIGEEAVGIWKYSAEPTGTSARTQVDTTGPGGNLAADVEGLTIARTGPGTGYLMASSQGDSTFVMYDRAGDNRFVKRFEIVSADPIDKVTGTDGIDVTTANLGPRFPHGVFVTQDDKNTKPTANQNYKLVPLERIIPHRPGSSF
jgi:3-phytase